MASRKSSHSGTVKKSIIINATRERIWRKIGNIAGLPAWVSGVKETTYLSKRKSGVGTVRKITFDDKNVVEEHVVAWEPGKYFTYIATEGLPLRAYVATISLKPKGPKSVQITWQSYLNSKQMSEKEFLEFLALMGSFYEASLESLKRILEK